MGEIRNLSQLLNALKHGYYVQMINEDAAHKRKKDGRHFCVSLAGHTIGIHSRYTEVYSLCKDYLCDGEPEINISISDDDIAFERAEAAKTNTRSGKAYLETLAVFRKISEYMIDHDVFLMHGAVIAKDQDAFLFTAKSGTGKTTHIQKWLDKLVGSFVVNGDKPLIKISDTDVIACGTPWCGKEQMGTNCMVPLRAIVLMERGEDNEIKELSFSEAFPGLLQQTYQPENMEHMKKTLRMLSQMKGKVRFYKFLFNNMKDDVFDVAYEALTEEHP